MRQLTQSAFSNKNRTFSKLPMRQLTLDNILLINDHISKLPMRQLTVLQDETWGVYFF